MDIVTERVQIPIPGAGQMGGYLARPKDGAPRPAVIVYMEIFGINSHIRDVTERVAGKGMWRSHRTIFIARGPASNTATTRRGGRLESSSSRGSLRKG